MRGSKLFSIFILISLLKSAEMLKLGLENIIPKLTSRWDKSEIENACTCGIFLSGQLSSGKTVLYGQVPPFSKEIKLHVGPCAVQADRLCLKKCTETMVSLLPSLGSMMCASTNKDVSRNRAHLFVKNCDDEWRYSGFSPAKEICCRGGTEAKCETSSRRDNEKSLPDLLLDLAELATDMFDFRQ